MKKKANKAVQKKIIIPELVEVKVGNAVLTISPTNGKFGVKHTLQEVEKYVVSADKETVRNEKKEIPKKRMNQGFYCTRTIVPAVMILAIHQLLLILQEAMRNVGICMEQSMHVRNHFITVFVTMIKLVHNIMEVVVVQVRTILVEILGTIKKIITKKT